MEYHGSNTSAKNKLVGPSTIVVFGVQRKCNAAMLVVWLGRLARDASLTSTQTGELAMHP